MLLFYYCYIIDRNFCWYLIICDKYISTQCCCSKCCIDLVSYICLYYNNCFNLNLFMFLKLVLYTIFELLSIFILNKYIFISMVCFVVWIINEVIFTVYLFNLYASSCVILGVLLNTDPKIWFFCLTFLTGTGVSFIFVQQHSFLQV